MACGRPRVEWCVVSLSSVQANIILIALNRNIQHCNENFEYIIIYIEYAIVEKNITVFYYWFEYKYWTIIHYLI